jgi:glycine betaine/proline transport system ATP-binding protein
VSKISVRNVYKVFGQDPRRGIELLRSGRSREEIRRDVDLTVAIDDVSFEVEEGELFVVMGLSGSGKSTLVRMINRLHEPTAGVVEIEGRDVCKLNVRDLRDLRMRKVSMVFQHFALFPHRKVWENAAYGLQVRGVSEEERRAGANRALELVGLDRWGESYPAELSGGMKQRVGLARGLATEASILLMDEPFSALDPLIRRDMQNLLLDLERDLKRTVVFITHDLNEAMRLGDRIAVLRDGKVVQIGTGGDILANPASDYVADFVSDVDRTRVLKAEEIMLDPSATCSPDDPARTVLERLEDLRIGSLYALDERGRVVGIAREGKLAAALGRGETATVDALDRDYPVVTADAGFHDLSRLAAHEEVPIAVTDGNGLLLGLVTRAALLSAVAESEETA